MVMLCKKLDKADLILFCNVNKGKWVAEEKQDGDRIRMRVVNKQIRLSNRRGVDVTEKYPEFTKINLPDCFLDGEMCVMDERGVSQFNTGISFRTHCKDADTIRRASKEYPVTYVVFDILEVEKDNLRNKPLRLRREVLEMLNVDVQHTNIQISHQTHNVSELWGDVTKLGGEGIVLKDIEGTYVENKRSAEWLKVKDVKEVDLKFIKYSKHNMGVTVESKEGIRITVNGHKSSNVQKAIDTTGECDITIRHLGQTESGKYRQPVFMKMVSK